MPIYESRNSDSCRKELDALFTRADEALEAGRLRSAFRLFLRSAKAGDTGVRLALGNMYIEGSGVKQNRTFALRRYRRAYRQGYSPAANNIGVMFRDENKTSLALRWFERAAKLGDGDANLEIAKIYLKKKDRRKRRAI